MVALRWPKLWSSPICFTMYSLAKFKSGNCYKQLVAVIAKCIIVLWVYIISTMNAAQVVCSIPTQSNVLRILKVSNIFVDCVWLFHWLIEITTEGYCMFPPHSAVGYHSTNQNSNNEWNNTGERDYNGCNGSSSFYTWGVLIVVIRATCRPW